MAVRASWKGYLRLSLVSCAVALAPATTTSERIRFNILNRKTGNRVRNLQVDAETGDPVESDDKVKGYRLEDGSYIRLEEEELDEVALESTHTIDIEAFVPRDEVDEIYLDESYYLMPEDKVAHEPYAVIREAMAQENLVGLARVVLYRRERLLMLQPRGRGLMATLLRYNTEVRDEDKYFADIPPVKIQSDMLDLAAHILESKLARFDPAMFEDRYEQALGRLIEAKRKGKAPPAAPEPRPSNVVDLMDALRRSVESEKRPPASSTRGGASRKRAPAKRGRLKRAS